MKPACCCFILVQVLSVTSASAQDAVSSFNEGVQLMEAGDFAGAIAEFSQSVGQADQDENSALAADGLLHISDCYRALGDTMEFRRRAEEVLRRYPAEAPAGARALLRVGEDTWRSGNYADGRELLSRLARQYPGDADAIALARMQMVELELARGDTAKALSEAESLLAEGSGGEGWCPAARILRDRARLAAAAEAVANPDTRAEGVAALEAVAGDPEAASEPRGWAFYHLSLARYWNRDYAGSVSAAESARVPPDSSGAAPLQAWAGLQSAIAKIALGDITGAYESVVECHRQYSGLDDPVFQESLRHRFDEIVNAARALGGLPPEPSDPDTELAAEAKAQTDAAFALVYTGDATGAISLLEGVVSQYASQRTAVGWARYRLAEAHYQNRDYAAAIATAQSLLAEYPAAEYTLLCAWTELMLAAAELAHGEPEAALATLERCRLAYSLVEDEGYRNALRGRLAEAEDRVRLLERGKKLAAADNRWLPRERRRKALLEYADLCTGAGDTMAALRAHIRLRQEFGDRSETMQEANEYLEQVLGRGNVHRQAEVLRQARDTAADVGEQEMVQEEIAYRFLAAGYLDEATAACREALDRFGREAQLSFRLAMTQGDALAASGKKVEACSAYLRAVPVPFVHTEAADRLARKVYYGHMAGWGPQSAQEFLDGLCLPPDDLKRVVWKLRAEVGKGGEDDVIAEAASRLATATTNEERLLLYWVLVWAEVWKKDYQSVEMTVGEMRAVVGDDEAVDRLLMDLVSELLGPRGEVLLGCILNGSHSEPMRRFAAYEMGWVKRFQKDQDGTLLWFEAAAAMPYPPGEDPTYPWLGHREAAGVCLAKGRGFYSRAEDHLQKAYLLARERLPSGVPVTCVGLGYIRELQGDLSGAAELYALAMAGAVGEDRNRVWADAGVALGRVRMKQGNLAASRELFEDVRAHSFHREPAEEAGRFLALLDGRQP